MKLIEYMPPFLRTIREFNVIFEAEDIEVDNLKNEISKLLKEVIVKTAESYGLERYEKIYHIKNVAETLEARRMTILLRMNNRTQYTYKWLINTLNEAIGKENYVITTDFKNYKMHIEIALNYTEAAEILKRDLVKQIPANLELDYRLTTKINNFIGAVISQQSYLDLYVVGIETKEDIELNQSNNVGLKLSRQEYMDLEPNTDLTIENESINLDSETGLKVSRQDYIEIEEVEK